MKLQSSYTVLTSLYTMHLTKHISPLEPAVSCFRFCIVYVKVGLFNIFCRKRKYCINIGSYLLFDVTTVNELNKLIYLNKIQFSYY